MKKITFLILFFSFFLFINIFLISRFAKSVQVKSQMEMIFSEIDPSTSNSARVNIFSAAPLVLGATSEKDLELFDSRVANLKRFFRQHDSPLYELAEFIVEVSDKYGFDYRLLPAIAMTESGLCNKIPVDSYNCFGWGINSTQTIHFSSFKEGIETVARGLRKNYIDKGLVTPEAIMAKYAPHSSSWAGVVTHFLGILE